MCIYIHIYSDSYPHPPLWPDTHTEQRTYLTLWLLTTFCSCTRVHTQILEMTGPELLLPPRYQGVMLAYSYVVSCLCVFVLEDSLGVTFCVIRFVFGQGPQWKQIINFTICRFLFVRGVSRGLGRHQQNLNDGRPSMHRQSPRARKLWWKQ